MDEALVQLLGDFVDDEAKRLDKTYNWKVPKSWPTCAFERGCDSSAKANVRLKRALSAAWHDQPNERSSIEKWYVSGWGGIHGNSDECLAAYAASSDEALMGRGVRGVASWSKILAIRKPTRYVIYDARVAAALNALQVARGIGGPRLFPQVPSRNKVIRAYQKDEMAMAPDAFRIPKSEAYRHYLALVTRVAKQRKLEIDAIEMSLFANAEQLAGEALDRQQNRPEK